MKSNDNDKTKSDLLEAAVKIEERVSLLYFLYHTIFKDDSDFWYGLMVEEKDHAAVLKFAQLLLSDEEFPGEVLYNNIQELENIVETIDKKIELFESNTPGKAEAYGFAVEIESSGFEKYYNDLMKSETDDRVIDIMQKINNSETDHAERIREKLL